MKPTNPNAPKSRPLDQPIANLLQAIAEVNHVQCIMTARDTTTAVRGYHDVARSVLEKTIELVNRMGEQAESHVGGKYEPLDWEGELDFFNDAWFNVTDRISDLEDGCDSHEAKMLREHGTLNKRTQGTS
ncbi:MAG: hypothetical protein GY943_30440 [Chloroflexi bacterium]|nr:hypothetical protein [Chloroflexota bacterium]